MLGGVSYLGLRVGADRGQLGLELLGVGQHAERVAGALQIADQPRRDGAQRRAREADRTLPPTLLCLAAVKLAGGGAAAALAERALRVVPGLLAVARRAPGALARRRDGALAPRKRAHLGRQLAHRRLLSLNFIRSIAYHSITFHFIFRSRSRRRRRPRGPTGRRKTTPRSPLTRAAARPTSTDRRERA